MHKKLIICILLMIVLLGFGIFLYSYSIYPSFFPKHPTFLSKWQQAGLVSVLQSREPITIFAPSEEAYARLPKQTADVLNNPLYKKALQSDLLYHVVKGRYPSSDLKEGMILTTIEGEQLKFTKDKGYWHINNSAYIEKPDFVISNGVIHSINNVLIPESLIHPQTGTAPVNN